MALTEPVRPAKLGRDADHAIIQAPTSLQFYDASGTAIYSPKTSVGTTAVEFVTPANAAFMVFRCSAASRYGPQATLTGASTATAYKVGDALVDIRYPVANVASVFIRAETGTLTVDFMYEMVGA